MPTYKQLEIRKQSIAETIRYLGISGSKVSYNNTIKDSMSVTITNLVLDELKDVEFWIRKLPWVKESEIRTGINGYYLVIKMDQGYLDKR